MLFAPDAPTQVASTSSSTGGGHDDHNDVNDDLRCIFSIKHGYFSHRNIGLKRRGIPVKDILHNPRYLRLGFNRITFFKK